MIQERKSTAALIINMLLVVMEGIGFFSAIRNNGWSIFVYYTQDSNAILMLSCLIYVIAALTMKRKIPKWVVLFRYVAASLVVVTFVIVITVLIPMCYPNKEWMLWMALGGANLFHHTLCLILAVVSLLFLEQKEQLGVRENVIAMLPTLLYAIVTTSLNAAKVLYGPYPFLYVYEQPVWASVLWFIGIVGVGYVFAWILRRGMARVGKR